MTSSCKREHFPPARGQGLIEGGREAPQELGEGLDPPTHPRQKGAPGDFQGGHWGAAGRAVSARPSCWSDPDRPADVLGCAEPPRGSSSSAPTSSALFSPAPVAPHRPRLHHPTTTTPPFPSLRLSVTTTLSPSLPSATPRRDPHIPVITPHYPHGRCPSPLAPGSPSSSPKVTPTPSPHRHPHKPPGPGCSAHRSKIVPLATPHHGPCH